MKIGCCLNMVANEPDGTGIENLETLVRLGYNYFELPVAEMSLLSDSDFNEIKARAADSGIPCLCCNNLFPKTIRLTGASASISDAVKYAVFALERVSRLGAGCVAFGSGPAKYVPDGFSLEAGYKQIVELLRSISPIAADKGIVIAIEPLRREECNIINTYSEGSGLARDVGENNVRALVDYYHFSCVNDDVQTIINEGEPLYHVHFAKPEGRAFPEHISEDGGYAAFFGALSNIGYARTISIEAYSKDFANDAALSLAFLRSVFANV